MEEFLVRSTALLGEERMGRIRNMHVAVFGAGGVGSYILETLARCGVGKLTVADCDVVSGSNINRQLIALRSTIGKDKVEAVKTRLTDINPGLEINTYMLRVDEKTIQDVDLNGVTYVADAVDSVDGKIAIIRRCQELHIPVISCMGTGNKTDPMRLKIADISKTSVCPLARVMRRRLKEEGVDHVKALYSDEPPIKGQEIVSSVPFVPSVAGILIAREILLT